MGRHRSLTSRKDRLATPNYGYEKRQKELAKKRKAEEKLRLKAERKKGGPLGDSAPDAGEAHDVPPAAPDTPASA